MSLVKLEMKFKDFERKESEGFEEVYIVLPMNWYFMCADHSTRDHTVGY